jgi:uncharacterized damage-inducible protein DinB
MQIQDTLTIYEYNYWANQRILTASAKVSTEQYVAPSTAHSYGSLHGTLVHILEAEQSWRMLCQHNLFTFSDAVEEANVPTLDVLMQRWHEEEIAMRDYLTHLGDDDMTSLVRYTLESGVKRERVLWHCLLHVVNHGTQHRSEAADILTGHGQSPGDLDFTLFLNENPQR